MDRRLGAVTDKKNSTLIARPTLIKRRVGSRAWTLFFGILFAVVFIVPLLRFLSLAFSGFELDQLGIAYWKLLSITFVKTAIQAGLSSILSLFFGTLLGFAMFVNHKNFYHWIERAYESLGMLAFSLPGATVALFVMFIARKMPFFPSSGWIAVIAAHVFMNFLAVAISLLQKLKAWSAGGGFEQMEAAATLGASPFWIIRTIFFPVIAQEWKYWGAIVFLFSATAFSTVLILGGGPALSTPEVLLFYSLQSDSSQTRLIVTAFFQFLFSYTLTHYVLKLSEGSQAQGQGQAKKIVVLGYSYPAMSYFLVVLALIPILALFIWPALSLFSNGRGLLRVSDELWEAALISILLSLATGFCAWISYLVMLRTKAVARSLWSRFLGLSPTFCLVLWMAVGADRWAGHSRGLQFILLVGGLTMSYLPLVAWWIESRLQSVPEESFEAAATLGCADSQMGRVLLRPMFSGLESRIFIGASLLSLGEIALASFLGSDLILLSTSGRRLAERYDFSGASWVLVVMSAFTLSLVMLRKREKADTKIKMAAMG